ncbi:hypothetical protein FEM48_Zijuj09G0089200 [Ziziphus jujuba var. spinosa]|uniref:PB1 domain-containing protein n=1 Tax=Ziziphus jujuba var. spinosa TaxID=714518 RepID=A0A978US20_ZIZJJ|nr:hypothetical protein FEM48_Zijuj09G0089200 [Ziziphus jujuba var. spinosa]
MENFTYSSYPDSGDSSPRSREIEFENPPPWDDQLQQPHNYKVKFMCSYGGKIFPRPHDNQLCYVGGETKILAVDRNIKFAAVISKLSALCEVDVSFKYQLPGEDLDALISVTNDDDLEHMMHEYDRLYRASAKPARMRLFLFPVNSGGSFGSDDGRSERERFVEALNSGPNQAADSTEKPPVPNNVDFLFGLEKGAVPPPPPQQQPTVPEPLVPPPDFHLRAGANRIIGSDPALNQIEFQRQLHDLQRMHIGEQEQAMYRRKSDDNLGYTTAGDYYIQKVPEKLPPMTAPPAVSAPPGYWQEKQVSSGGGFAPQVGAPPGATQQEQPMYMVPAPGAALYHQQMVRPVTAPPNQAYYPVPQQRMPSEVYREQPVYNVVPQAQQQISAPPPNLPPQAPKMTSPYTEGVGLVRQSGGVTVTTDSGQYTQVAYDSATGRQVYYTAGGEK